MDSAVNMERKTEMNFWNKCTMKLRQWMTGRHGADHLGMFTLFAGLLVSLIGSLLGFGMASFLGMILYVITLFRMFSRNEEARRRENQKYLELTGNWTLKIRQFFKRMKNRKQYKYFRCPQCKQLLRLKRGCGEKTVTCAKCGHQFSQKA